VVLFQLLVSDVSYSRVPCGGCCKENVLKCLQIMLNYYNAVIYRQFVYD